MRVRLERTEQITPTVRTFWFRPPKPVDYTPGQFIEMHLPHKNPDTRGQKRWFTLSSSPTEPLISISTKILGAEASSFKRALARLRPMDEITISDPMGDFVLPQDKTIPLVFVAGGIGVTPFRSIIKWLLDTKQRRDIQMIHAVSTPKEAAFKELFELHGIKPVLVLSKPQPKWRGQSGLLDGERILELAGTGLDKRFYVSGPEPMVEQLCADLAGLGVKDEQIVGDFFPGYTDANL